MPTIREFTRSRFILCEGFEDAAFVRALLRHRTGIPEFDVSPNVDLPLSGGGGSAFHAAIMAAEPLVGFPNVKDVVIVSDNDSNPARSFNAIRRQIESARAANDISRNWGDATAAGIKAPGDPSLSIWMWPGPRQNGCLETLLWRSIKDHTKFANEVTCVEAAFKCSGADQWTISKLDKARIRCFLALMYKRNPAIGLGNLFRESHSPVPLSSDVFDPFVEFLRAI